MQGNFPLHAPVAEKARFRTGRAFSATETKGEKKMKKKPLLTISLLTSDRKDTIRKCLDSLQPLRDAVDSELIIVDTGCDEEMLGIIGEYTDQIVPFEWCDDFAKARNAGLDEARGSWFMFIDDDEWFEDVRPVAEFFRSGAYKDCVVACYQIRNYTDMSGKMYNISWATRLFKLAESVRFHGSIHENVSILPGAVTQLPCYAHHYGYAYQSAEERNEHFRRNVVLLEKMIEKEPENTRWWKQLAQEYNSLQEYHKVYEICCRAEGLCKDQAGDVDRGVFYSGKVRAQEGMLDYEGGVRDYEEAIKDLRNNSMCQLRLHARGAKLYFCLEDYDNCERCCQEYLSLYETLKDHPERQAYEGNIFTQDACEPTVRDYIYCFLIEIGLRRHEIAALRAYFDCLAWREQGVILYDVGIVQKIIHALAENEYEEFFVHIAQCIVDRKSLRKVMMPSLQTIEQDAGKAEPDKEEEFRRIIRVFSQVSSEDYYICYLKVLNAGLEGDVLKLPELLETLFDKVTDVFQLDGRVWDIARQYQVELEPLFFKIPYNLWKDGVVSFCENSPLPAILKRVKVVKETQRSQNIRYSFFYIKTTEARLMYGEAQESYPRLRELLLDFTRQTLVFYRGYFTRRAFEGDMDLLPDACRAAVRLEEAFAAEEAGDYKKALTGFKNSLGVCVTLDSAITAYSHFYADEVKRQQQDPQAALKLRMMAERVMEQIPVLVENGQKEEAILAARQLHAMLPEDEEIQKLELSLTFQPVD